MTCEHHEGLTRELAANTATTDLTHAAVLVLSKQVGVIGNDVAQAAGTRRGARIGIGWVFGALGLGAAVCGLVLKVVT